MNKALMTTAEKMVENLRNTSNGRPAAEIISTLLSELKKENNRDDDWISVNDLLPENDSSLFRYSSSDLDMISVLACGYFYDDSEKLAVSEVNRLCAKLTGIPYLDENRTGEWEWSKKFRRILYWQPLPAAKQDNTQ